MQSPLSFIRVAGFLLINILVSALTTWVVVRTLVPPLVQTAPPVATAPTAVATDNASANKPDLSRISSGTNVPDSNATAIPNSPANANANSAASPTPQPTPTLLKASAKGAVNLRISSVIYPGQLSREVVVMVNEGEQVDMTGWTLVPPRGAPYMFTQVVVFKNSFVNLHTTTGADVPTDLFWGLGEPMWQSGDEVKLLRKDGSLASTFTLK